jgi:electron transfer flavoprotein beta subunit
MRGIRQVASVNIPTFGLSELGMDANAVGEAVAKVERLDYFVPAMGKGAEILQGSREQVVDKLIELMKAKGGLK